MTCQYKDCANKATHAITSKTVVLHKATYAVPVAVKVTGLGSYRERTHCFFHADGVARFERQPRKVG